MTPSGLQAAIDDLLAPGPPGCRAFVRPSGTEDAVRVPCMHVWSLMLRIMIRECMGHVHTCMRDIYTNALNAMLCLDDELHKLCLVADESQSHAAHSHIC